MTSKQKFTVSELVRLGVPHSKLARKIGISRVYVYAFLEPGKYPAHQLSEENLRKIARFEGRPLEEVRAEYRERAA